MDQDRKSSVSILVVGSLPPPLGGCTLTLQQLVSHLRTLLNVDIEVVNTSGVRGCGIEGIRKAISICYSVWRMAGRADVVSLHVATTGLPIWGLSVFLMSCFRKKPFVLRKFAGMDYRDLGRFRGSLAHFVASRASIYFCETKAHLERSQARGLEHAKWLPTARPLPALRPPVATKQASCRRFVYIGQVRASKGIVELVHAAELLPSGASVDVYGPLFQDLDPQLLVARRNITYRGIVEPTDVLRVMQSYDALILPSKAPTEGYPGAILEAFMAGLPVIATASGAIPEIVDESVGILVRPGDVNALASAMQQLIDDDEQYHRMCLNTFARAEDFSSEVWAERFVKYCRDLTCHASAVRRV